MFDLKYWLAINEFQKFGPIRWQKLIKFFPNMEEVWRTDFNLIMQAGIESHLAEEFTAWRGAVNPNEKIKELEKENIKAVTILDNEYPALLKEIPNPPPLLYYKGDLPQNEFSLAVVGTRKITPYGKQALEQLVRPLAKAGLTIVSGLALGIDGYAHQITLEENGKTVAVLASGLSSECLYPGTHRHLAGRITANGCLMTEFPLHMPPLQHNFPYRNRVISGLSLGALIIEATEDSGSLITARHALEQNREVFAVPGDIFQETSIGPNNLLKMGARVVTQAEDILEILNLKELKETLQTREIAPDTATEAKILEHLSKSPVHIDQIIKATGVKTSEVSSALTLMEMKGMVRHLGGMQYVLAR